MPGHVHSTAPHNSITAPSHNSGGDANLTVDETSPYSSPSPDGHRTAAVVPVPVPAVHRHSGRRIPSRSYDSHERHDEAAAVQSSAGSPGAGTPAHVLWEVDEVGAVGHAAASANGGDSDGDGAGGQPHGPDGVDDNAVMVTGLQQLQLAQPGEDNPQQHAAAVEGHSSATQSAAADAFATQIRAAPTDLPVIAACGDGRLVTGHPDGHVMVWCGRQRRALHHMRGPVPHPLTGTHPAHSGAHVKVGSEGFNGTRCCQSSQCTTA